jgi:hypothetical protein
VAKAALWATPDAETRKRGERTGLDTPVVHAVNDVILGVGGHYPFCAEANALSVPPGEYGRKAKTQRN